MDTSFSWIKAYVPDLDCTAQEYTDAMTLSGTKVEGFTEFDKNLDKIVVGKINKIEKHPDADKLVICQVQVDEDGKEVQIVTGASNVKEGQKVPVVLDGGHVASSHKDGESENGFKIKKGKLRGVESFGMMCSIEELGSTTDMYPDAAKDGIYILSDNPEYKDAKIGSDVVELLGLHDVRFEYEITSNRVDCFGMIGIAREVAATFGKELVVPEVKETGNNEDVNDYISVEVKTPELCPRYTARVVKNIKLAPSPEWMQRRLASVGIRPINNIVDITNYVMEEYAQPMHAYDLDKIEDRKIIVRKADKGEKFVTLDGQERELDDTMLMICDGKKPVGIAGIMGGENSMITDDVTTMLFEAATFDGTNIRLSGKKLGMRTDAQAKFEKGLDPNNAIDAMNRACQLVEELGAGEVVGGAIDYYPVKKEPIVIPYDADKINALLGTDIDEVTMVKYFEKLDLAVDTAKKEVIVPTWRQDLERLADLAEEVARFYGYDKIPMTLPESSATAGGLSEKLKHEKAARIVVEGYGFNEGMTFSFESPKVYDKLNLTEDDVLRKSIKITNPLGEDYSVMRTSALGGMLTSLSTNYNRRNKNVRLYELANVYLPKQLPLTELPDERMQLTLGMYGDGDFFTMKGVIETLMTKLGLKKKAEYDPEAGKAFLHPGRQAKVMYDGVQVAYLGEVHPVVQKNFAIGERTYIAVVDMKAIMDMADFEVKYEGVPKFPAMTRDISLSMKKEVLAGDVEKVISKKGGKLVESYELFDVYEGSQLVKGFKSLAYKIVFRAKDHTLKDDEVNAAMDKIIKALAEMDVELRQ
ncbi:phenylalanine--tRNA ligase subunit beta [Eubacterium sp. MSJ-13]|uniref:phenylalanine--tRNA ligase subunit beta n=1 Tax=Eubacterium sp. MSJ-13 TaxID=2841513 RepID=UPI001C1261B4|nr:phenylalanine--tRNA ligase subunit beta [Eubacterium sp. MSJ-13]MBU5478779.1 phenylalanine--tRNA ligase subunit beta [Eubacterium sp. MSJ-13]